MITTETQSSSEELPKTSFFGKFLVWLKDIIEPTDRHWKQEALFSEIGQRSLFDNAYNEARGLNIETMTFLERAYSGELTVPTSPASEHIAGKAWDIAISFEEDTLEGTEQSNYDPRQISLPETSFPTEQYPEIKVGDEKVRITSYRVCVISDMKDGSYMLPSTVIVLDHDKGWYGVEVSPQGFVKQVSFGDKETGTHRVIDSHISGLGDLLGQTSQAIDYQASLRAMLAEADYMTNESSPATTK